MPAGGLADAQASCGDLHHLGCRSTGQSCTFVSMSPSGLVSHSNKMTESYCRGAPTLGIDTPEGDMLTPEGDMLTEARRNTAVVIVLYVYVQIYVHMFI